MTPEKRALEIQREHLQRLEIEFQLVDDFLWTLGELKSDGSCWGRGDCSGGHTDWCGRIRDYYSKREG